MRTHHTAPYNSWTDSDIQDIQSIINHLEEFSYFRFFFQVISVILFGNLLRQFVNLPIIVDLLNLNTIFITSACFSARFFYQKQLDKIIQSYDLMSCLFADTQLILTRKESLFQHKLRLLQKDSPNFEMYLHRLTHEIAALQEMEELSPHQKNVMLDVIYNNINNIESQRPYSSYFYRLMTRQKQLTLHPNTLYLIWEQAVLSGHNDLILRMINDMEIGNYPLNEEIISMDNFKKVLQSDPTIVSRINSLFGEHDIITPPQKKGLSQQSEEVFPMLDRLAQIACFINFSLIDPVRDVQQNLQTFNQLGLIIFASGLALSAPVFFLIGTLAAVFLITQSLELSMRYLTATTSLNDIIAAYAQKPAPHYERLLHLKIHSLLTQNSHSHPTHDVICCEQLSEAQCFKLYQIFIENYRKSLKKDFSAKKPLLDITAVLPVLVRLRTNEQRSTYLARLRPISAQSQQRLLEALEQHHISEITSAIKHQEAVLETLIQQMEQQRQAIYRQLDVYMSEESEKSQKIAQAEHIIHGYIHGHVADSQLQSLNLEPQIYDACRQLKDRSEKCVQNTALLQQHYDSRDQLQALKDSLRMVLIIPSDGPSDKIQIYEHLVRTRQRRNNLMSYVFPINTINTSVIGILFYFVPLAITVAAMAYTIAPLALVFATALAVFGSYQYLKYQEKQDLDQLSLADFWGQTIGPINTELFVSKIQRLQNATSAAVDAQLIALLRAIEAGVCQQQDRHLLCQIMPDLIQLSQLKGTVLCQQTLEKIKQYTIEDNHSERATQYSDNTSSANMPVEQSQIMTEIEELERRVDSSHHDKGVFEKQWYLLQQKISQQLQNTVLTERLDSLYQRYEQKIMRHNSAPTETEDAGPSNKSQQSSTRQ